MTISLKNIGETFFKAYLVLVGVWLALALSFDMFMIGAHFFNPDLETKVANTITWKIDGTFKNDPDNIWYEGPKK